MMDVIRMFIVSSLFLAALSAQANRPVVFEHASGKVTIENKWEDEPNNEPYRFWVTVECKHPDKNGKIKHEVVTDWKNCGLKDFKWDQYHSNLEVILMHKNRQNNYEACNLEDKRHLKVTDYCSPEPEKGEDRIPATKSK